MKFLKYLLLIVVVLVLFVLAKGFFTPSVYYESEIDVNKPANEVWAIMSDESRVQEWIEGIKKIELISGTSNTVGAVSKIYIVDGDQEMVMEETITKFDPNETMAMTFTMDDFMTMDYEIVLSEQDGKTNIKTKSTTAGIGIIGKSMVSFSRKAMKSQEDQNMGRLKKLIEENTKNYFPETSTEAEAVAAEEAVN